MDIVQNCGSYINTPPSQTYRPYFLKITETFHIVCRIEIGITLLIRELAKKYATETDIKP
jgi:hypothetical protein